MTSNETEIRRLAGGSIDTEYYIRHCHLVRSRAAHRAIARALVTLKRFFVGNPRGVDGDTRIVGAPAAAAEARRAERMDRRAA